MHRVLQFQVLLFLDLVSLIRLRCPAVPRRHLPALPRKPATLHRSRAVLRRKPGAPLQSQLFQPL
jgi:hypothetical protein